MYYLANAKLVNGSYVLNFFADTKEDLAKVPTDTKFIASNGTDYGIPLASSIVTVIDKGVTKNYMLNADGKYVEAGGKEPVYGELEAKENKTYKSEEVGLDGWTEVHVNVPATPTEEKTVTLALAAGDQVITPTAGKNISKVTITKPATLLPENIKKGITIAGVAGTYEAVTGA